MLKHQPITAKLSAKSFYLKVMEALDIKRQTRQEFSQVMYFDILFINNFSDGPTHAGKSKY